MESKIIMSGLLAINIFASAMTIVLWFVALYQTINCSDSEQDESGKKNMLVKQTDITALTSILWAVFYFFTT